MARHSALYVCGLAPCAWTGLILRSLPGKILSFSRRLLLAPCRLWQFPRFLPPEIYGVGLRRSESNIASRSGFVTMCLWRGFFWFRWPVIPRRNKTTATQAWESNQDSRLTQLASLTSGARLAGI